MAERWQAEPFLSIWFGNFYQPAFDDRAFVDQAADSLRKLGFNAVLLDSKAWQDFQERLVGGEPSQYVAQQEYMMESFRSHGLSHWFLSLYLNGDNLYPHIRFSPPIYGESVTLADGSDGKWYKYWSDAAKDSMQAHVSGLLENYRNGHTQIAPTGEPRLPMCSMWDPIVAPSFDAEGRSRYLEWLMRRYGNIAAFNRAYETGFLAFEELTPEDCWFTVRHGDDACYSAEDMRNGTPAFINWADNMRWRADELALYFEDMNLRLKQIEPRLFLMPDMAQWGYLLNVDASKITGIGFSDLWDTAMRGIDIYRLARHVDMCHFYSVPVAPDGGPDAYVAACQHAMMRAMNPDRPFLGGIYWGRFLYSDIYNFISPCEVVGSIVASGAGGYSSYGYCGLDDGGLLHRMDEGFLESLQAGNEWARQVIHKIKGARKRDIAILFPSAMSLLMPLRVEGAEAKRLDLLGLFRLCCDLGYQPDVIDPGAVVAGALNSYRALLIPANACYDAMPDSGLESAIRAYVMEGGSVVHGARDQLVRAAFGIGWTDVKDESYEYLGEGGLLLDPPHCAYDGEQLAAYRSGGGSAITSQTIGRGKVFSFGFLPGYQYAARTAPHVPRSEGNRELYPFTHMRHNALADILASCALQDALIRGKNLELARFESGFVLVNHSSHPVRLPSGLGAAHFSHDLDGVTLIGHSAVYVQEA